MKAIDVLRLLYKEMKADEYDSEVCSKKIDLHNCVISKFKK